MGFDGFYVGGGQTLFCLAGIFTIGFTSSALGFVYDSFFTHEGVVL